MTSPGHDTIVAYAEQKVAALAQQTQPEMSDDAVQRVADELYADIARERDRQEELRASGKFSATCATAREDGGMNDFQCFAVLGEEFGEVARAVCESIEGNIENRADLREELIQTAAVAVAWIERLDALR